jgi:hypothetical protein
LLDTVSSRKNKILDGLGKITGLAGRARSPIAFTVTRATAFACSQSPVNRASARSRSR